MHICYIVSISALAISRSYSASPMQVPHTVFKRSFTFMLSPLCFALEIFDLQEAFISPSFEASCCNSFPSSSCYRRNTCKSVRIGGRICICAFKHCLFVYRSLLVWSWLNLPRINLLAIRVKSTTEHRATMDALCNTSRIKAVNCVAI